MATLGIKGHKTRGEEVIQLLEMLGGENSFNLNGAETSGFYYSCTDNNKIYHCWTKDENAIVYTLEEFFEKFPYKVGDKVTLDGFPCTITGMNWEYDDVIYYVKDDDFSKGVYSKDLQSYEEETNIETDCKKCGLHYDSVRCFDIDYCPNNKPKSYAVGLKDGKVIECEANKEPDMVEDNYRETLETKVFGYKVGDVIFTNNTGWVKITNKLWDCYAKEHIYGGIGWINEQEYDNIRHKDITGKIELDKVTDKNNCDINCPDGYEFYDDNGNLIGNKIIMKLKKPTYPKTYEECCEVLMGKTNFSDFSLVLTKLSTNINEENSISPEPPYISLINKFYKLLICRDAYWRLYGEENGLGKSWEPDWREKRYIIYRNQDNIIGGCREAGFVEHHIFEFPIREMRDAFYNTFKGLIEQCKELL